MKFFKCKKNYMSETQIQIKKERVPEKKRIMEK